MTSYLLERAFVDDRVRDDVEVEIVDERFATVRTDDGGRNPDATRVPGLTLPGLANCHSHAFHRALRGRVQRGHGTFWTWREQMYDVAGRLDPDGYHELARATYREMAAAGITTVGEFHYLHHRPDGGRYDDANAMGEALIAAARDVGVRIALLDTCYLAAGIDREPEGVQSRFTDGDAGAWAERVTLLEDRHRATAGVVVGAAVHSVRAVPRDQLATVAGWARGERPLHVHLSEQPAENEECQAAYGVTPTRLLADTGVLGPMTSAVHATHLTEEDILLLGGSATHACFCPTTERDLGDGIGPGPALRDAGCRLTLGSDSHAVINPFEELRALELDERLASLSRGHWTAAELLVAGTEHGHASLGFADAGRIAVGCRADLVTLDLATPRTAGTGADEHTAVYAASAADVRQVIVDGRIVVGPGEHQAVAQEVGRELDAAIGKVWS